MSELVLDEEVAWFYVLFFDQSNYFDEKKAIAKEQTSLGKFGIRI
jgi:hypothetical protein